MSSTALVGVPFPVSQTLLEALERAYAGPPRAYHHFGHVHEVLGHFREVPAWIDAQAVAAAILFHDAVYEPGRADNEARSAELAKMLLAVHVPGIDLERVASLILLTARHGSLRPSDVDAEAALFLDCDMAILGSSPERFARYEEEIAAEYGHVPKEAYAVGRAMFFQKVLATETIYLSPFFRERLEAAARANIERALNAGASFGP
ncbi:hypothetical protein AKJ09_10357 [Labilithrix luteola]|uniref:Metal-dependent HD superfamily phosphohydrolase n=1 Tax=Labilithrix luteola TaxID=1391654 RepID=A0A0K1QD62_9BACT|nr:hypothetical protein [Labilithrix luteola]AKV03694.1 hypothetical protein AKJ09_10357 [Labilithrix luteola]